MYAKLSEIIQEKKGKVPTSFSEQPQQGYAPYVDIDYFDRGILNRFAKIDEKTVVVDKNDVLIVWDGARFGLSAIGYEGVLGSTLRALRSNKLIPRYLYYFMVFNFGKIHFKSRGTGTPHIDPLIFWNLEIYVPTIDEQQRIVNKIEELLGVIDKQVRKLDASQETLIKYRQSVLTYYLNSSKGTTTTLGKILKPRKENIKFNGKNGNTIYIAMECIAPNSLTPFKTDLLSNAKSNCHVFKKNDVLYGRMRSYLNKVFKAEMDGAASAEFIVFPPTSAIMPDYLKYILHQKKFVSFATRNASGDRPRIKFEDLAPFSFCLPSISEQKTIVKKIETAFACADKAQIGITTALEQAKQLRQSILRKALMGKLIQ